MTSQLRGIFFVLTAAVLWSTGGLFIKKIPVDPLTIVCLRAAIAGLTLASFLRLKQIRFTRYLVGYIFAFSWLVISFVTATKLTSAGNAIALQYTAPLYLYIYGVWKKEIRVTGQTLAPILFIFFGICSFLAEPNQGSNFVGNMVAISSGMALALMTTFLHRMEGTPAISLTSLSNLATALLVLPFLPDYSVLGSIDSEGWLSLLYLGVIQIGLAYVCFVNGVKYVNPLQATVLALAEAILNPVWVALFWGEIPSKQGLIGAAFIMTAVLADTFLKMQEHREHSTKEELTR